MRLSWVLAVFLLQTSASNSILAVGPPEESALNWQAPFTVLSTVNPDSKLVLILVTNDDAFYKHPAGANQPVAAQPPGVAQQGWCAAEFHHTCQQVLQLRPDLKDKISFQSIFAGTPSELSGGQPHTSPKRVVCFLCNKHYKLLALSIGIPNADDLLTLIEDAQEVKILAGLNGSIVAREEVFARPEAQSKYTGATNHITTHQHRVTVPSNRQSELDDQHACSSNTRHTNATESFIKPASMPNTLEQTKRAPLSAFVSAT